MTLTPTAIATSSSSTTRPTLPPRVLRDPPPWSSSSIQPGEAPWRGSSPEPSRTFSPEVSASSFSIFEARAEAKHHRQVRTPSSRWPWTSPRRFTPFASIACTSWGTPSAPRWRFNSRSSTPRAERPRPRPSPRPRSRPRPRPRPRAARGVPAGSSVGSSRASAAGLNIHARIRKPNEHIRRRFSRASPSSGSRPTRSTAHPRRGERRRGSSPRRVSSARSAFVASDDSSRA